MNVAEKDQILQKI